MKRLPLYLFTFCCFFSLAQPSIQWQKSLGGTFNDEANSILQTTDGGYIVAGFSFSNDSDVTGNHGNEDYWVVKLNSSGTIQWQKSLGGSGYEKAYSIQQTTDGGYIAAGFSNSNNGNVTGNHGNNDYWVVKLNSSGTMLWQKSLGGTGHDFAYAIQQTTDSGYIVTGISGSNDGDVSGNHGLDDYWVVKLNSAGTIQWQKCLGGIGYDWGKSIHQVTDGGYIVAGYSHSNNNGDVSGYHGGIGDYWVVKLNSTGIIQWQKCLGGTGYDFAYAIQQTTDSGYIVTGKADSNDSDVTGNHGGLDFWLVKLNHTGTIQWQKSLGGTGDEEAYSIQQTTDGGYIVAGFSNSNDSDVTGNHGNDEYWVVKLNSSGTIQWQKCLGGTGVDGANSIRQTTDGGYIVAGSSNSNDSDVTGNHGSGDYWIVKLNPVIPGVEEINSPVSDLQITPNPVSQSTVISFSLFQPENITVKMYDITGRFIKNLFAGNLNPGDHEIKWNVVDERVINNGVYLLNFSCTAFSRSFKLVVVE